MINAEFVVIDTKQETPDVKSIKLSFDSNKIDYKPGQYMMVELDVDDPENTRPLPIASSPTEDFLLFSTKISQSAFKQKFSSLEINDKIKLKGPMGVFVLKEDAKEIIFLGGGIGITPFRDMIKYSCDKKLPMKLTLLYSNKTPDDIVYRDEWPVFERENRQELEKGIFKFIIFPKYKYKIEKELKQNSIPDSELVKWEDFYEYLDKCDKIFDPIEKNLIEELKEIMYSFDIDYKIPNINSQTFKKKLEQGVHFLKKLKDKDNSKLSLYKFVKNPSNQNFRIERIIEYEIVPVKLYHSKSYDLYCFLSIEESDKLTFNIEIYGKSRMPKISVKDKLFEYEKGSKHSFFRIPLLDNSTTSSIQKVQRLMLPDIKRNLKQNFFEILHKYSKAIEMEPKFIEQFKNMVVVFQDVDHYYKKVHKEPLRKTEMNTKLLKPNSHHLIIKMLTKKYQNV